MDYGLLISGIITSIVTALIGIWYTRQYLTDSYRRKILKIIFLGYIITRYTLKNGKYKEVRLYDLLEDIYLWKFGNRLLFFIVFIVIMGNLGYYKSFNGMANVFDFFVIIYFYSLIFLFSYLNSKINFNRYIKYAFTRSLYINNSDFFFEWVLLTIIFLLILFKNFSLSVLSSNLATVLAIFLVYTFFLLLPIFLQYIYKFEKYLLKHNDLEYVIFQDFNNIINIPIIVHIIIHINGETIKGKIEEIGDELVLINDETESHFKIYVPWENIVFFEVVNN